MRQFIDKFMMFENAAETTVLYHRVRSLRLTPAKNQDRAIRGPGPHRIFIFSFVQNKTFYANMLFCYFSNITLREWMKKIAIYLELRTTILSHVSMTVSLFFWRPYVTYMHPSTVFQNNTGYRLQGSKLDFPFGGPKGPLSWKPGGPNINPGAQTCIWKF